MALIIYILIGMFVALVAIFILNYVLQLNVLCDCPVCPAPVVCPDPIVCPDPVVCPAPIVCPAPKVCPAPTVCPAPKVCPAPTTCPAPTICPTQTTGTQESCPICPAPSCPALSCPVNKITTMIPTGTIRKLLYADIFPPGTTPTFAGGTISAVDDDFKLNMKADFIQSSVPQSGRSTIDFSVIGKVTQQDANTILISDRNKPSVVTAKVTSVGIPQIGKETKLHVTVGNNTDVILIINTTGVYSFTP
jgi:hypothetical protein